jgi:hypothetical protein
METLEFDPDSMAAFLTQEYEDDGLEYSDKEEVESAKKRKHKPKKRNKQ